MKLLVDMNLSPRFVAALSDSGFSALHWSVVGAFDAPDIEILAFACVNRQIVVTHDLDFSAILAKTKACCPSVIQIRALNSNELQFLDTFITVLNQNKKLLNQGALITMDEKNTRIRLLPL